MAASQGHVPLAAVIAAAIAGAVLRGRDRVRGRPSLGRRMLDSTIGRFVPTQHVDRAETVLRRRGAGAVFFGRFTAALRVMIPGLAGMAGMPPVRFLAPNITGGAAWGALCAVAATSPATAGTRSSTT